MFFDDLLVGFTFETGRRALTLQDITEFAQTWDPQPFHIDAAAAAKSPYGGIIASGFHTILIAFNLSLESDVWRDASLGSPGMEHVKWLSPVRPGDTLFVRCRVVSARPSASRPDRGRIDVQNDVFNQDETLVASYLGTHILRRSGP